jgi:hypothetical protein
MNSQSIQNSSNLSNPADDVFATAPTHATQTVSLIAAVLITGFGLFALSHGSAGIAPSQINGIKVTNLAPVEVRPSADEMRAAATLIDARTGAAVMSLPRTVEVGAGLLGAQLAMPYYSFGTTASSTASTKE